MYACDHRMGKRSDKKISVACVKTDNCVEVINTCLSSTKQCHTRMILSISRHSKRKVNGIEIHAMGRLCGGDQILMTESRIVICTSKDPGGGAGISAQKLTMYRSIGSGMVPLLARR
eukprot:scaffold3038_cov163-Amphora_coffeaeformis.AAC.11